jgi:hypothetical protein
LQAVSRDELLTLSPRNWESLRLFTYLHNNKSHRNLTHKHRAGISSSDFILASCPPYYATWSSGAQHVAKTNIKKSWDSLTLFPYLRKQRLAGPFLNDMSRFTAGKLQSTA